MLRDNIKSVIVGTILGVVVTCGVANADTLYDVMTSGVKIVVDGKELHATDADGNKVEPIVYNGTTYLPVRAVSNAVGKAVYWDGPTYTVYLGTMDGKLDYPTVSLADMMSVSDKISTRYGSMTDNYENRYSSFADDSSNGKCKLEYLLNMKYSSLKGTLYVPQGETRDGSGYIKIIADGKTLYTSPDMTKTSRPIDIDVNVTGYNDVIIQYDVSNMTVCLGNAGFYQ